MEASTAYKEAEHVARTGFCKGRGAVARRLLEATGGDGALRGLFDPLDEASAASRGAMEAEPLKAEAEAEAASAARSATTAAGDAADASPGSSARPHDDADGASRLSGGVLGLPGGAVTAAPAAAATSAAGDGSFSAAAAADHPDARTTAASGIVVMQRVAAAERAAAVGVLTQGDWRRRYLALLAECSRAAKCTARTGAAAVLKLTASFVCRSLPQVLLDAADGGAFAASLRPDGPFSAFWQAVRFGETAESATLYCRVARTWRVKLGGVDPGCP